MTNRLKKPDDLIFCKVGALFARLVFSQAFFKKHMPNDSLLESKTPISRLDAGLESGFPI
ncbi:hypothetical protein B9T50_07740 [Zymomonas mobilis subsp. mobilis]|nr:hypothetical protein B9T50_07740 [Zymomonas mobilis subsp. mobilis]